VNAPRPSGVAVAWNTWPSPNPDGSGVSVEMIQAGSVLFALIEGLAAPRGRDHRSAVPICPAMRARSKPSFLMRASKYKRTTTSVRYGVVRMATSVLIACCVA
jgi:hypothetical protein